PVHGRRRRDSRTQSEAAHCRSQDDPLPRTLARHIFLRRSESIYGRLPLVYKILRAYLACKMNYWIFRESDVTSPVHVYGDQICWTTGELACIQDDVWPQKKVDDLRRAQNPRWRRRRILTRTSSSARTFAPVDGPS